MGSGPCHKPIGAEFYEIKNEKYLCVECYMINIYLLVRINMYLLVVSSNLFIILTE